MLPAVDQLRAVGRLQQRLLPTEIVSPPGWHIAVHYSSGDSPGGDYYDVVPLGDGRLLLLVADVSGHDTLAAVMVVATRVILHSCPLSSGKDRQPFCPLQFVQPPHAILSRLNHVLVENTLEEQFMTAFLAVLDPRTGRLAFGNAGHPPPRWWHAARGVVEAVPDCAGLPLGIEDQVIYSRGDVDIAPGDVLVCYTDGLTESLNDRDEQFGCKRLDAVLRRLAPLGAEAVKLGLLAALDGFMGGKAPHDDLTILVLERL